MVINIPYYRDKNICEIISGCEKAKNVESLEDIMNEIYGDDYFLYQHIIKMLIIEQ